jgi:hypothetical protein
VCVRAFSCRSVFDEVLHNAVCTSALPALYHGRLEAIAAAFCPLTDTLLFLPDGGAMDAHLPEVPEDDMLPEVVSHHLATVVNAYIAGVLDKGAIRTDDTGLVDDASVEALMAMAGASGDDGGELPLVEAEDLTPPHMLPESVISTVSDIVGAVAGRLMTTPSFEERRCGSVSFVI